MLTLELSYVTNKGVSPKILFGGIFEPIKRATLHIWHMSIVSYTAIRIYVFHSFFLSLSISLFFSLLLLQKSLLCSLLENCQEWLFWHWQISQKITKQGVTHPASNPPSRVKIKGIVGGYPKIHIGLKQEQNWGKMKVWPWWFV